MEFEEPSVDESLIDNIFRLETGSKCFLCWTDSAQNNQPNSVISQVTNLDSDPIQTETDETLVTCPKISVPTDHSLLRICRYLKLNANEIFKNSPESDQFHKLVVPFCAKCVEVVQQLTGLLEELEVLQMKVDHKLQTFHNLWTPGPLQNLGNGNHDKLVNSLRTGIKISCNAKLKEILPRVQILAANLSQNVYDGEIIKAEDCETPNVSETTEQILIPVMTVPGHKIKKSQCYQCGKWINQKSLGRHRRNYCVFGPKKNNNAEFKTQYNMECDTCHQTFENRSSLLKHIRMAHPSIRNLTKQEKTCEYCQRVIGYRNIYRHQRYHCTVLLGKNPAEVVTSDPLAETELKKEKLKKQTVFVACNLCGELVSKKTIFRHKKVICKKGPRLVIGSYNKKRKCGICGQEYQHYSSYKRHLKTAHGEKEKDGDKEVKQENLEIEGEQNQDADPRSIDLINAIY